MANWNDIFARSLGVFSVAVVCGLGLGGCDPSSGGDPVDPIGPLSCADGSTVEGARCNGFSDCVDGSDELGCETAGFDVTRASSGDVFAGYPVVFKINGVPASSIEITLDGQLVAPSERSDAHVTVLTPGDATGTLRYEVRSSIAGGSRVVPVGIVARPGLNELLAGTEHATAPLLLSARIAELPTLLSGATASLSGAQILSGSPTVLAGMSSLSSNVSAAGQLLSGAAPEVQDEAALALLTVQTTLLSGSARARLATPAQLDGTSAALEQSAAIVEALHILRGLKDVLAPDASAADRQLIEDFVLGYHTLELVAAVVEYLLENDAFLAANSASSFEVVDLEGDVLTTASVDVGSDLELVANHRYTGAPQVLRDAGATVQEELDRTRAALARPFAGVSQIDIESSFPDEYVNPLVGAASLISLSLTEYIDADLSVRAGSLPGAFVVTFAWLGALLDAPATASLVVANGEEVATLSLTLNPQPCAVYTDCAAGQVCADDICAFAPQCDPRDGALALCLDGEVCGSDGLCSALCDNGVHDVGELCDIGIAAGQPGACPTSCESGDVCQSAELSEPGTCLAQCVETPKLASGQTADLCCPEGTHVGDDIDCVSSCGDGFVDPVSTELCDIGIAPGQPGACPTLSDCSAGDVCADPVVLDEGTCTAECGIELKVASGQTADLCCPEATHVGDDIDCVSSCGDGFVDPASTELCDTGIIAGQPGACPTLSDCAAGDVCEDAVLFDEGTCAAECGVELKVESGQTADLCCPDGAHVGDDIDCVSSCGDGFVDPVGSELCDTGIAPGQPGACPSTCPVDDNLCTSETLSGAGCQLACVSEDITAVGVDDGCCPLGGTSGTDIDCIAVDQPCPVAPCARSIDLDVGADSACAVRTDGTVWCWGNDEFGQVSLAGSRQLGRSSLPAQVPGITDVTQVAVGNDHVCVLKLDGTVVCWGSNVSEQAGIDNNPIDVEITGPVAIAGITDATQLVAGPETTCALRGDEKVVCWGAGLDGQLGVGSFPATSHTATFEVRLEGTSTDLTGVDEIFAARGSNAFCARRGTAMDCWGGNGGRFGLGTGAWFGNYAGALPIAEPITSAGRTIASVALGMSHLCVITSNPTDPVACGGEGPEGQIGDGDQTNHADDMIYTTGADIGTPEAIWSGHDALYMRDEHGRVYGWGKSDYGQVLGENAAMSIPTYIPSLDGAREIRGGIDFACALTGAGFVHCWGRPLFNRLGFDTSEPRVLVPSPVQALGGCEIALGDEHTCVRLPDMSVQCAGRNSALQLGHVGSDTPVLMEVPAVSSYARLDAGGGQTCGLAVAGDVECWGSVFSNGGSTSATPQSLGHSEPAFVLEHAGGHACMQEADGTVLCWGAQANGRLGNGATSGQLSAPDDVLGMTDAAAQLGAATSATTCAVTRAGELNCWGKGGGGQIGNTAAIDSLTASRVVGPSSIPLTECVQVASGTAHSCAICEDQLYCWGLDSAGQFGVGLVRLTANPVALPGGTNLSGRPVKVVAGDQYTCVLVGDGTVWCAGGGSQGELGGGTTPTEQTHVIAIPGIGSTDPAAVELFGGPRSICAVIEDGSVKCWGDNAFGQLGDGTTFDRSVPTCMDF